MTVGDLRAALAAYPDDLPVTVQTASPDGPTIDTDAVTVEPFLPARFENGRLVTIDGASPTGVGIILPL